jgi:hypothetical protein
VHKSGSGDDGMTAQRVRRLRIAVVIALMVSCIDLWVKAALPTPDWALHQRSIQWVLGSWLLLFSILPLARVPSNAVAVGAGMFSGGVLGNLISAGTDHLAVPNPLLLQTNAGGFAFNLADAFIVGGNLILMIALSELVIRHRARLPRHAPWRHRSRGAQVRPDRHV